MRREDRLRSRAENTGSARIAHEIWLENVNRGGGLLGREVRLELHDDAGDQERTRAIYADLVASPDIDIVACGYGTNSLSTRSSSLRVPSMVVSVR
ncbi:hypothetical protein B2G71_21595 [Novosphingobium sp. PC22D]|nr:hypothetical protein B2G71_21595 [Novosphingobium sp. PC22D]